MNPSLLFLPDISGFTEFVQNTEAAHSQHVIAELLEVLIDANTQGLQLAEIEGDALFFYKEEEVPSLEKLLAQIETMFTAFYSHLKLLEKNRICPCNACATAPKLQLKIIAHIGELQFINVQNKRKPFGTQVIEVHRFMKNSVESNTYALLSKELTTHIKLPHNYQSNLFKFKEGENEYDGKKHNYLFSVIDKDKLKLKPFSQAKKITFSKPPALYFQKTYPVSATQLLEYITNFSYRHKWVQGVKKFEFNKHEVNRVGTEHVCVIDSKHFDFVTITKEGKPGQYVYGELTTTLPVVDELYQFFIITPLSQNSCTLEIEVFWKAKSFLKQLLIIILVKNTLRKNTQKAMNELFKFVENK